MRHMFLNKKLNIYISVKLGLASGQVVRRLNVCRYLQTLTSCQADKFEWTCFEFFFAFDTYSLRYS